MIARLFVEMRSAPCWLRISNRKGVEESLAKTMTGTSAAKARSVHGVGWTTEVVPSRVWSVMA